MLLFVDKPSGWTSHDVVKYIKIHGKYKKVWHCWTLDPLATWLLIILTDEDTKRMTTLVGLDKVYTATIDLTHKSDTWDIDYYSLYEEVVVTNEPTLEEIVAILQHMVPSTMLPVPSFSAKKIAWKKMYEAARKGIEHDMQKNMAIMNVDVVSYAFPYVSIRCHVGSGTFIRSIAHALWEKLGTWGIITALHRESIWDYHIDTISWCIRDLADIKQRIL